MSYRPQFWLCSSVFQAWTQPGLRRKTMRNRLLGRTVHQMRNMNHQNQNMMATTIKLFTQICVKDSACCAHVGLGPGDAVRPGRQLGLAASSVDSEEIIQNRQFTARSGRNQIGSPGSVFPPASPSQTFSRQTASAALSEHSKCPLCRQNGANGPFSLVKRPIEHNGHYAHRVLDPSRAMSAVDIDPSSAGLRPPRRFLDGSCVIMQTSATQTEQNSSGGACAAHVDRVCSMA